MSTWIVIEGEARPLDFAILPSRERYGWDWILTEAPDEAGALAVAGAWDATHGSIPEMTLFAAAYRSGAFGLPGDALVGVAEIAQRAGVRQDTVQAWRNRHPSFPDPAQALAMGPVWWWSDVARWLAIPRRPGRPRK